VSWNVSVEGEAQSAGKGEKQGRENYEQDLLK